MKRILSIALLLSAMQVYASEHGSNNSSHYEEPEITSAVVPVAFQMPAARPNSPTLTITNGQLMGLLNAAADTGAQRAVAEVTRQLQQPTRSSQASAIFHQVEQISLQAGKDGLTAALGAPSTEQAMVVAQTVVNFMSGKGDFAQGAQAVAAATELATTLQATLKDAEKRAKAAQACFGGCMRSASAQVAQTTAAPTASVPATTDANGTSLLPGAAVAANTPADTTRSGKISGAQKAAKLSKRDQKLDAIATAAALKALEISRTTKV